jgi:shikimate kinase
MEMSLESSESSNLSPDPSARQRNAVAAEAKSVLHRCPIYFVGCMGCGKSAVAKYAAFELGYRFLDTDELVEAVGGKSVSELFAEYGEQAFRDLETTILDQVQAYRATCVATGGGIVLRDANWARMQTGIVVWLDAHPTVLARRLDGDETRPLLAGCASMEAKAAKLGEILEARRVRYQQADIRIPISEDQPVDNISTEVLRCLSNFIKENPPRFKSKQDELYPKDTPRQPSRDGG